MFLADPPGELDTELSMKRGLARLQGCRLRERGSLSSPVVRLRPHPEQLGELRPAHADERELEFEAAARERSRAHGQTVYPVSGVGWLPTPGPNEPYATRLDQA